MIAEIIATGASTEELAEAHAWTTNDEALLNSGRSLPDGRIGRLASIPATLEEEKSKPQSIPPQT